MKEKIVRGVAGGMVLISVILGYYINIHWFWLTVFVGINLLQSSFTGFCPLEKLLEIKFSRDKKGMVS